MYWDIHLGIKNIFRLIPIIWFDFDFDWEPLVKIMEYKLRRMEKVFRNGNHVGCEKDAKRMLICAILLKRLREDKYWKDSRGNKEIYRAKYDQEYCFKIMGKYLTGWWD